MPQANTDFDKALKQIQGAIKNLDRAYVNNGHQVAGKLSSLLDSVCNLAKFGPAYIPQANGLLNDLVSVVIEADKATPTIDKINLLCTADEG